MDRAPVVGLTVQVIGLAEQPAQVFFSLWDPLRQEWLADRVNVPDDISDEIFDEILCDDALARGLDWHSREYLES